VEEKPAQSSHSKNTSAECIRPFSVTAACCLQAAMDTASAPLRGTHLDEGQEHVGAHRLLKLVELATRHEPLRLEGARVTPRVVHRLKGITAAAAARKHVCVNSSSMGTLQTEYVRTAGKQWDRPLAVYRLQRVCSK
jgi:hypothetical protein